MQKFNKYADVFRIFVCFTNLFHKLKYIEYIKKNRRFYFCNYFSLVANLWIPLFRHSHQAKLAWQDLTGRRPKSYSETRWWSKWEVYQQLFEQFEDVFGFLEMVKEKKICAQIVPQLLELMSDPQHLIDLKLKLAVTIDVGQHFVKATYYLERDSPLVFSCYEKLKAVAEACQTLYFPNVRAIAVSISNQDGTQNGELLERKAKECVQPAILRFL